MAASSGNPLTSARADLGPRCREVVSGDGNPAVTLKENGYERHNPREGQRR